jgi:hypothetical protein
MDTNNRPAWGLATLMMLMAPRGSDHATVMLSRIVEAQAAADEANDLVGLGVIDHARYERAACDRDEAVEAAAIHLGRVAR